MPWGRETGSQLKSVLTGFLLKPTKKLPVISGTGSKIWAMVGGRGLSEGGAMTEKVVSSMGVGGTRTEKSWGV